MPNVKPGDICIIRHPTYASGQDFNGHICKAISINYKVCAIYLGSTYWNVDPPPKDSTGANWDMVNELVLFPISNPPDSERDEMIKKVGLPTYFQSPEAIKTKVRDFKESKKEYSKS